MLLSIRRMRELLKDYHQGREVPPWVKGVMDPQPIQEADEQPGRLDAAISRFKDAANSAEKISAANELAGMLESVADHSLVTEIAVYCNHKYLSRFVLERIGDDPDALHRVFSESIFDPASEEAMARLCRMAGSIRSTKILCSIARDGPTARDKARGAGQLALRMDELEAGPLKLVAIHAGDDLSRMKAVERLSSMAGELTDPAALKIIAVNSDSPEARLTALSRLSGNYAALKTVALCSMFGGTRLQALGLLRDDSDVFDVAMEATDDDVGKEAARYLARDAVSLTRLYEGAPLKAVRDTAAVCLCAMRGELFSVKQLKIVVLNGGEREKRDAVDALSSMVREIDDPHALLYVALWGAGWQERKHALDMLSGDRGALELIVQMGEHDDSKKVAAGWLGQSA